MATGEVINKPLSLPPYPEMILEAIEALNEENGSNKSSISKYIESKYGGLPQGHKVLLNLHLAKMRDTNVLVFWKNNYKKCDPNAPPRRGRGRPRKGEEPSAQPKDRPPANLSKSPRISTKSSRPRGRPRKKPSPLEGWVMTSASVRSQGKPIFT